MIVKVRSFSLARQMTNILTRSFAQKFLCNRRANDAEPSTSALLLSALLVFAGYYLGAKIGFALTFGPHPVSVLWPPNSVLAAALLLTPFRSWWTILAAAFAAHIMVQLESDVPPTMVICWFISNSCEALMGASCACFD
jgi:integral membrane sensor domain MASE1